MGSPSRRTGLSPVTAYTLLLSASTVEPVLLVDSLARTTARTAATTALAVDLSAPDAHKLAVIGAGQVAIATEVLTFEGTLIRRGSIAAV